MKSPNFNKATKLIIVCIILLSFIGISGYVYRYTLQLKDLSTACIPLIGELDKYFLIRKKYPAGLNSVIVGRRLQRICSYKNIGSSYTFNLIVTKDTKRFLPQYKYDSQTQLWKFNWFEKIEYKDISYEDSPVDEDDLISVPEFSIRVTFSDKAKKKIIDAGETIQGDIIFDGNGEPIPGIYTAPHRNVVLGIYDFEGDKEGIIKITDAKILKTAYKRLSDKNYFFDINIWSTRKVYENNILNGGYVNGRYSDLIAGKPIDINLSLLK